jgi:RecB family exonuclease
MRVSYSALETYKQCPLKFKYQEIDRIRVPKTIEALFGGAIHRVLKKMFEKTPLFPTLDELLDFFNKLWTEDAKDEDEKIFNAYLEEGYLLLKNFYKKNPPWNFNVLELESRFEVIIKDPKNNENHVLAGIIDRIDKATEDDLYEIIDYKTSKRMPSKEDLDQNAQLSIYNLGLLKRWPHLNPENVKLSFYFLKHNEKIETKRTTADLMETKNKILETIREIQELIAAKKDFIPTPSVLCDWCGYKKMCPMWKHLYSPSVPDMNETDIKSLLAEYFNLKDQNQKNNKRINEIQNLVVAFMDKNGVERVFGDKGYLTRVPQQRIVYDMLKIEKILKELGKWEEVSSKKSFFVLKASKKQPK